MSEVIRLLLADDHPVVRAGLRAVLETEPGFRVVAEASTAEQAVALAAHGEVDVVLMDLRFGAGMHGAEATAAITERAGGPRVLVRTTYDTDADILAAIENGATGYLLEDAPPEELAAAVRTAAAGQSALAPAIAHRLMDRMRVPGTALSRRETEILLLVAEGMSNQQISKELYLTACLRTLSSPSLCRVTRKVVFPGQWRLRRTWPDPRQASWPVLRCRGEAVTVSLLVTIRSGCGCRDAPVTRIVTVTAGSRPGPR